MPRVLRISQRKLLPVLGVAQMRYDNCTLPAGEAHCSDIATPNPSHMIGSGHAALTYANPVAGVEMAFTMPEAGSTAVTHGMQYLPHNCCATAPPCLKCRCAVDR